MSVADSFLVWITWLIFLFAIFSSSGCDSPVAGCKESQTDNKQCVCGLETASTGEIVFSCNWK